MDHAIVQQKSKSHHKHATIFAINFVVKVGGIWFRIYMLIVNLERNLL